MLAQSAQPPIFTEPLPETKHLNRKLPCRMSRERLLKTKLSAPLLSLDLNGPALPKCVFYVD
jgi:hypothetical protein